MTGFFLPAARLIPDVPSQNLQQAPQIITGSRQARRGTRLSCMDGRLLRNQTGHCLISSGNLRVSLSAETFTVFAFDAP
jgi:hypothetical protein